MKVFAQKLNVRLILPISLLLLLILPGCTPADPASLIKKFTPPEDEAMATNYIALLRQNKFERIQNDLDPSIKSALTQDTLVKMAKAIPPEDPVSVKVIGAQQAHNPDLYKINLSFEYQFPSKWLLINVATQKKDGVSTIIGFNVYPLSDSLENINRFTLTGKNPLQYATLAFAILIPLFILYCPCALHPNQNDQEKMALDNFHSVWNRQAHRQLDNRPVANRAVIFLIFGFWRVCSAVWRMVNFNFFAIGSNPVFVSTQKTCYFS